MGNKQKISGKDRRAALREEKKKALASRALVTRAKEKLDPLDELSINLKMNLVNFDAIVTCSHWNSLDPETAEWVLKLEETNVREMYEKCDWGWNGKMKKEEMTDDDARYLIARSSDGKRLGFSHFRFDMDFDDEVLYCYELQIEEHARRKGLGCFMLGVLEALTVHYNMKKTMLTVFKHNHPGKTFFKKNGYKPDETSPEDTEDEIFCYEILSKYNIHFVAPAV
ncbi:N-alpha-acetyltransferase 40 [Frankliniella fusca]|uniref:N-alpha-acetyltransferase 40 n=1 Tax=Frankliniella fusca TaxID=407009 RepID=A0AAE1LM41_9NEOP|nr:N-alpha-acetyltransferase 40 [Frankliniella fusca]